MKVTVSTKCQKFEVTERKDGTWHVRVTDKEFGKAYDFECKSYCETGDVIWNQANNHDVGRMVSHKMCKKFNRAYWND